MGINELLAKMEAAERAFLESRILAPVLPHGLVRVRIASLTCTLRVEGEAEPGWAILQPLSLQQATVVGRPTLRQLKAYLALFPAVRLLLVARQKESWLAIPAHRGDRRFEIRGMVPLHLVRNADLFQQVVARFDGNHFWFEDVDRHRSPAIAAYLRQSLVEEREPEGLHKATLTAEEREAYRLVYHSIRGAQRKRTEVRLARALAHGGAELASYLERENSYTVNYSVDGHPYYALVSKEDLTVLSAGVCLAGLDELFDLQSLVGVMREGANQDQLFFTPLRDDDEDE